jgi:hypothetical protein
MKGLDALERAMLEEMYWKPGYRHGPGPGKPFSNEEKKRIDLLVTQGRIVMMQCECGQVHPVITPLGHEAARLQKLADTTVR